MQWVGPETGGGIATISVIFGEGAASLAVPLVQGFKNRKQGLMCRLHSISDPNFSLRKEQIRNFFPVQKFCWPGRSGFSVKIRNCQKNHDGSLKILSVVHQIIG